jgi:hypothetical protein
MVTPSQRLEQEQEAWASWRAEDYSWAGLARKRWLGWAVTPEGGLVPETDAPDGSRSATLQDYWREEETRLFQMGDQRWTIAHCPLHTADGRPAKASWNADQLYSLQQLVLGKLEEAWRVGGKQSGLRAVDGPDGRAQLQGVVLVGLPLTPAVPAAVNFSGACFAGPFEAIGVQFADQADFTRARFFEGGRFLDAAFLGECHFDEAQFLGEAAFRRIGIDRPASFYRGRFLGDLDLTQATTSALLFDGSHFHGTVDLRDLSCRGVLSFSQCEFEDKATFRGVRIDGEAVFAGSLFNRSAQFDDSRFESGADLRGSTFKANLSVEQAAILAGTQNKGLDLSDCEIEGRASFMRTRFEGRTHFQAAHFAKVARFDNIRWPKAGQDWHATFRQARFDGSLAFTGSGFGHFAAFHGAELAGGVELEGASEREAKRIFLTELKDVAVIAAADAKAWAEQDNGSGPAPIQIELRRRLFREQRLREIEGGCRVLKHAMGKAADRNREQLLFRFELIARRAQRDTPRWEKAVSHLYSLTSDYGASMIRPLGALALSLAIFAILFFVLAVGLDDRVANQSLIGVSTAGDAWNALSLAWSNTFRPLAVMSPRADDPATSWSGQLLYGFPPAYGLLMRMLATLESLTALFLAFLFALALRRRFHMSS